MTECRMLLHHRCDGLCGIFCPSPRSSISADMFLFRMVLLKMPLHSTKARFHLKQGSVGRQSKFRGSRRHTMDFCSLSPQELDTQQAFLHQPLHYSKHHQGHHFVISLFCDWNFGFWCWISSLSEGFWVCCSDNKIWMLLRLV